MEENDNIVWINLPRIKKYIKKHPVTGIVEQEKWFQFHYRVTGVRFNDNCYSWNKVIYVNIEVSDKYWKILNPMSGTSGWGYSQYYMWSSKKRNQYIRDYVKEDVKQFFNIFSFPYRIEIKTIKMKQE
jgi:hypothetical protein